MKQISAFPDQNVDQKTRATEHYGLQFAKAIYSSSERYGTHLFYFDDQTYSELEDYAYGRQSEERYKPLLDINPNDQQKNWVRGIRWAIKNYATKRLNVAVKKILERDYDPIASAIDNLSLDAKKEYQSKVRAYINNKEWYKQIENLTGMGLYPKDIPDEIMPNNEMELTMFMENDYKTIDSTLLELGISKALKNNDWRSQRRKNVVDLFIAGFGMYWIWLDENKMPRIKRIRPDRCLFPFLQTDDPDKMPYAAYVEEITVADFIKENKTLSKSMLDTIIEQHANKRDGYDYTSGSYDYMNYQNVDTIKVMRFRFKATEYKVKLKRQKYGNMQLLDKDENFLKDPKAAKRYKSQYPDREVKKTPYTAVYEGSMVVGSEYIYNYGKTNGLIRNNGNLMDVPLGVVMRAPNMENAKYVSTVKQMIPVLDNLQTYHLKVQQMVAKAIPKGHAIDIDALRKVDLKWGGKQLSDQDKLEMFYQRGTFVFAGNDDKRYGPGSNYQPFREMENGLARDVVTFVELMRSELDTLDEIIGINKVTAASSVSPEMGKGVAQIQEKASETALGYLHEADELMSRDAFRYLGKLFVESVKANPKQIYEAAYGKLAVDYIKNIDITKSDWGIDIQPQPTDDDWLRLYQTVEKAIQTGQLGIDDQLAIEEFTNLKQARHYMRLRMAQRERMASEAKQKDYEMNAQLQQQSSQQNAEKEIALTNAKTQGELAVVEAEANNIRIKGEEERKSIALKEKISGPYKLASIEKGQEMGMYRDAMNHALKEDKEKVTDKSN